MELRITDEQDPMFLELSKELNQFYMENIGDKTLEYKDYIELTTPHTVFLILQYGRPIACAAYCEMDQESIEIKRVYVKYRYRKKGIAYKLIKQIERLAIENNYRYSYVAVGKINEASIDLFKKLGYEQTEPFGIFKDDDFCICMRKEFKTMIF